MKSIDDLPEGQSVTAEELKALQRTDPFSPFRIVLDDGKSFEVPHPNFLWVRAHTAHVGTHGNTANGLWDRYEIVELARIKKAERLPSTTTA